MERNLSFHILLEFPYFCPYIKDFSCDSLDFLYNPQNKYILGNASVFLLPHYISQVCILGEMLRVPMITLNYEPNLFCNHMFSMRPDPRIMNQALVAMVRELRPRVVAVVTEGMLFLYE